MKVGKWNAKMMQGLEEIREEELKLYMYIDKINIWQKVVSSSDTF
jgi:hypothetical protein